MNSLIQQLYMIPTFKNDILAVEDPSKNITPDDNLLFQTQCLFAALSQSVKQYYSPKLFCNAFKDIDKKPINVFEQMDVDEFFNLFLDRIETSIKQTPQQKTIQYHFGGLFANQFIGKECPHSSTREEPFIALNLQVKNKKSLEQCLESFVEGEMLQGSDAYYCEKCDKKVATLKRVCIKKLPRYLIIVLKRFEFNYDTMQKFKVNDYCEFPMKINMEPYTEEGLKKLDKQREKRKKVSLDSESDVSSNEAKSKQNDYYDYKLTGVIIHIGTAETGHYYSLILDREKEDIPEKDRWYEFNDALVNQYDINDLKDDAFGGVSEQPTLSEYSRFQAKSNEKIRNAYLLVYDRVRPYEEESLDSEEIKNVGRKGEPVISDEIRKAVLAENIKYWYNKFMFGEDYFEFVEKISLFWNSNENMLENYPSKNMDYHLRGKFTAEFIKKHAYQNNVLIKCPYLSNMPKIQISSDVLSKIEILVCKFTAIFTLTTLFRSKNRESLYDFIDILKAYLNKSFEFSQWFIWQFTHLKIISEFLLENSDNEISRFIVGLLYCAFLKIYDTEKIPENNSVLVNFANFLFTNLEKCKFNNQEFYMQLIGRLAFISPEMKNYFYKIGAVRRLLGYYGKEIPESKWNIADDIKYTENSNVEIGFSHEIDEKYRSPFEEFYNLRKDRFFQQIIPINTFLIDTLSVLFQGNLISTEFNHPLSKNILISSKIYKNLIKDSKNSLSQISISRGLAHFASTSIEISKIIIRGICEGILDNDWDELKKYFYVLKIILSKEIVFQEFLIDFSLTEICETLKLQQNAYYSTVFSADYIFALAADNLLVKNWFQAHALNYEFLFEWFDKNPMPELTNANSIVKPYKSKEHNESILAQYSFTSAEQVQNSWRSKTNESIKLLNSLKEGIFSYIYAKI